MRTCVAIALVTCALAGVAGATTRPPTLIGHLRVASAEPSCTKAGCGAPLVSYTLVFSRAAKTHLVRTVPKTGAFRAVLAPGTYSIAVKDVSGGTVSPAKVVIRRGATARLAVMLRPLRSTAP